MRFRALRNDSRELEEAGQQRRAINLTATNESTTGEESSQEVQRGADAHSLKEPTRNIDLAA